MEFIPSVLFSQAEDGIRDHCVTGVQTCALPIFSMSNRMGSADKTLGLKLMKAFLRIIAVKRNKKNSALKAWFMENVPNSEAHLAKQYKFADLGLAVWAR